MGRDCVKTPRVPLSAFLHCTFGARRFDSERISSLNFAESNVREVRSEFSHSLGRSRSCSVCFGARMPVGAGFSRESGHPGIAEIGQKQTVGLTVRGSGDVVLNMGPKECDLSMARASAVASEPRSRHFGRLADTTNTCRHNSCRPNCSSARRRDALSRLNSGHLQQIRSCAAVGLACYSANQKRFGSSLLEADSDFDSLNDIEDEVDALAATERRSNGPRVARQAVSTPAAELSLERTIASRSPFSFIS